MRHRCPVIFATLALKLLEVGDTTSAAAAAASRLIA